MADAPLFEEVTEKLKEPIQRYLHRFVGDSHIAEDLLQETLLRISKGLSGFRGDSSLKTWGFKVATHTAVQYLRKSKAGLQIVAIEDAGLLPDKLDEIEERLVVDEMNSCLREEIDSLPEDYRAAILLHDMEGMTAAETATVCGCSVATAKIRIHRARARLRKALEKDCTFYYDRNQVLRCDRKSSDEEE